MRLNKISTNRGLVKMIVIILVILILLAYFGFNLRSIVNSETFQDNWSFLTDILGKIWAGFIKPVSLFIWDKVIVPLIFNRG